MTEKIDELETAYGRLQGDDITLRLAAIIKKGERRHQLTLEALHAVDEGRVVEHDDVMKWASSLGVNKPPSRFPRS